MRAREKHDLREFQEFDASQSQPWELPKKVPRHSLLLHLCSPTSAPPSASEHSSGAPFTFFLLFLFLFLTVPLQHIYMTPSARPLPSPRVASVASPLGHASPIVTRPLHPCRVALSRRGRPRCIAPSPRAPLVMRRLFTACASCHASPLRRTRPSSRVAHRVSPRHARRLARTWSGGRDSASECRVECSTGKNSSVVDYHCIRLSLSI